MYFWQKVVFGLIGLIIVLIGAKQLDDVHTPVTIETESQIKKLVIKIINTPPGGICVVLGSIIILCTIVTPPPRMKISDKNGEILSIPIKKIEARYTSNLDEGQYIIDIRDDPEMRNILKNIEEDS